VFFFSSRRRHTRFSRDWSSDVCSSDLQWRLPERIYESVQFSHLARPSTAQAAPEVKHLSACVAAGAAIAEAWVKGGTPETFGDRSEERRVGKEWRSRGAPEDEKRGEA